MKNKRRCDFYRVHNFFTHPDPSLTSIEEDEYIAPFTERQHQDRRMKRVERIERIESINAEIRKLDKIYCVKPKEAYYEIHYGVTVERTVEKVLERFSQNEHEVSTYVLLKLRGLVAPSTLRRAITHQINERIGRTVTANRTNSEQEEDTLTSRQEYVNRNRRR